MKENQKITVKSALEICEGEWISGDFEQELKNFCIDTRQIQKGDIYVGIKGETTDGNLFFEKALELGAAGCLIQGIDVTSEIKEKYKDRSIIRVKDTIEALQKLASYKREQYDIPVVAVTGSVGKTSTKDMIASVMSQKFHVLKTSGNYNNHIGLPLTLLRLEDHDAVVVEMGMNHFGEIRVLTNIAKPTVAVLTNIGTAHIGILGSRENILKAKLEILEGMNSDGHIILNNDNDLLHTWGEEEKEHYSIITYGIENPSDYQAFHIMRKNDGSTFDVKINDKNNTITVPIGGDHFILNSLAAISVGSLFEISPEKIKKGIQEFELTKRRMEMLPLSNDILGINDSYNASFDSVKPAIAYLAHAEGKRKIAVLGDMLELGDYAKELHEKVGEEVAKNKIDILIAVGDLSKYIMKKAEELGMPKENITHCIDAEEAAIKLEKILEKGDRVLLKASNAMKFNIIVEKLSENLKK